MSQTMEYEFSIVASHSSAPCSLMI